MWCNSCLEEDGIDLSDFCCTLPETNTAIKNPPFWWYFTRKDWDFIGYVSFKEGIFWSMGCMIFSINHWILFTNGPVRLLESYSIIRLFRGPEPVGPTVGDFMDLNGNHVWILEPKHLEKMNQMWWSSRTQRWPGWKTHLKKIDVF